MAKQMKLIDGTNFDATQTGEHGFLPRTRITALGDGQGGLGFYGIRDKKTGAIHVPSVYYEFCYGDSQTYWDSETNATYVKGVWKIRKYENEINKLLKRYRKKAGDFEIVAFSMKEGKRLSYNSGYSVGASNIYYGGASPVSRDDAQNIRQVVVLQTSLTPTDEGEVNVSKKNAIVALEVKEV